MKRPKRKSIIVPKRPETRQEVNAWLEWLGEKNFSLFKKSNKSLAKRLGVSLKYIEQYYKRLEVIKQLEKEKRELIKEIAWKISTRKPSKSLTKELIAISKMLVTIFNTLNE